MSTRNPNATFFLPYRAADQQPARDDNAPMVQHLTNWDGLSRPARGDRWQRCVYQAPADIPFAHPGDLVSLFSRRPRADDYVTVESAHRREDATLMLLHKDVRSTPATSTVATPVVAVQRVVLRAGRHVADMQYLLSNLPHGWQLVGKLGSALQCANGPGVDAADNGAHNLQQFWFDNCTWREPEGYANHLVATMPGEDGQHQLMLSMRVRGHTHIMDGLDVHFGGNDAFRGIEFVIHQRWAASGVVGDRSVYCEDFERLFPRVRLDIPQVAQALVEHFTCLLA